jgi:hypothetical protein
MAAIIKTHHSTTPAAEPTNLEPGELAVNIVDQKLWVGDGTATPIALVDPADIPTTSADIPYDNTGSGLTADNVQDAVDEIVSDVLSGFKIEVYAAGALPPEPRDANTLYFELVS